MFKSLLTSSHTFRTWLLGHLKWTLCYTVLILPKSEGHTHLAALCETCLLFTDWNVILWMSHSFNWLCYPWFRQSDKQCNNTMCIESLQIYPDSLLHANCTQYHTLIFTLISIQYTLWPVACSSMLLYRKSILQFFYNIFDTFSIRVDSQTVTASL